MNLPESLELFFGFVFTVFCPLGEQLEG